MGENSELNIIEEVIGRGGYASIDRVEKDGVILARKRYSNEYGESGIDDEKHCDEAFKVFEKLKSLGIKNLPEHFERISPYEILMSDLSENEKYFVISWTDVNANVSGLGGKRYEISKKGATSFQEMLELLPSDLSLMSESKVLVYLDTLIFSLLISDDHVDEFKGTFCDFDDVCTPENCDYDITEDHPDLFAANICLVHSAIKMIIERVFTEDSQRELMRILDQWKDSIITE